MNEPLPSSKNRLSPDLVDRLRAPLAYGGPADYFRWMTEAANEIESLRTPQGEPALTHVDGLPGTREPVAVAAKAIAGESPANLKVGICPFCNEPTDQFAGDPGRWPLEFTHPDRTGLVRQHHVRCVQVRLFGERSAHETKSNPVLSFVYATCTLGPGVAPKVTIGYSTAEEAQRVHGWLHENRHCEHQWEDGWCGKCGKEGARNAVNGKSPQRCTCFEDDHGPDCDKDGCCGQCTGKKP